MAFADLVPPELAWVLILAGLAIVAAILWPILRRKD